jgi:hypothetical protein
MNRASRIVLAATTLAIALASSPAFAQTAEERETARQQFEDGKKKRDAGDKEGALTSFKAADALMNVPTTKLAVARAYLTLGRLVEARDAAYRVSQIPVAPKEPAPFRDARSAAAKLADDLAKRIPSVTFNVIGVPADDEANVTIDGVAVPAAALAAPRKVNPGKHQVVATLKERDEGTVKQEITLAEADNKKVDVDLTELGKKPKKTAPVAEAPVTPPPATTEPPPTTPESTTSPLVWIGGGLAVVGAGVGTAFGLMSMSDKATADESCREGKCPPQAHDALDSANQNALISTIGFAAAGVGVGVAVAGLFLSKSSKSQTARVTPFVSASGAGLYGSF